MAFGENKKAPEDSRELWAKCLRFVSDYARAKLLPGVRKLVNNPKKAARIGDMNCRLFERRRKIKSGMKNIQNGYACGSTMLKVEPLPTSLCTSSSPFIACARSRLIASPRPVPA